MLLFIIPGILLLCCLCDSSSPPPDCPPLPSVSGGTWLCDDAPDQYWYPARWFCHLQCHSGLVPKDRSNTYCWKQHLDWNWNLDPASLECVPALLVLANGVSNTVELYSMETGDTLQMPDYPSDARMAASLDWVDGSLLLCGGSDSSNAYGPQARSCLVFSPHNNTWEHHSDLKENRFAHYSTLYNSQLVLFGGGMGDDNSEKLNRKDCCQSPPCRCHTKWEENMDNNGLTLDIPRTQGACAVRTDPDTMVVIGGTWGRYQSVYQLNLATGNTLQLADLQQPRAYHACAGLVGPSGFVEQILVTGGCNATHSFIEAQCVPRLGKNATGPALDSVEILDLKTGTWSWGHSLLSPRMGHALVTVENGVVLAIGGHNPSKPLGLTTVDLFSPNRGWIPIRHLQKPATTLSVAAVPRDLINWRCGHQLTIYGEECVTPCTSSGENYSWCRLEHGGWDYCSTSPYHTRYGVSCLPSSFVIRTSPCQQRGEDYHYCWTDGSWSWDYCSPSSCDLL